MDFAALKRGAEAQFRATQVGLAEPLPLTDLLDDSSVERLPDYVRALGNDAEQLAVYRIFWPSTSDAIPYLEGKANPNSGEVDDLQKHHAFLRCWLQFLQRGEPASLKAALNLWTTLKASEAFHDRLRLWVGDGAVAESALNRAEQHLIDFSVLVATDLWDQGVPLQSLDLIESAFRGPFAASTKEVSAIPLVEVGDRAETSLKEIVDSMPAYGTPSFTTNPPKEVYFLERLSSVIAEYAPNAEGWKTTSHRWYDELAHRIYQQARISAVKDRYSLIHTALQYARDPEFRAHLEVAQRDNARIGKPEFEDSFSKSNDDRFRDLMPVRSTPAVFTISGIGTKLFRWGIYERDHSLNYAILFITFFFIPIVPICRYVVRDEGNGYRFFGKAGWSKWMHIHMTLAAIGIIALFTMINQGGSSSDSANSPRDSLVPPTVYTNPVYTPPPTIKTPQQVSEDARYERLTKERENLIEKANSEYLAILEEEEAIKSERESIQKLGTKIEAGKSDDFDGYERRRRAFNRKVDAHNDRVAANRKRSKRIDEIEKALH